VIVSCQACDRREGRGGEGRGGDGGGGVRKNFTLRCLDKEEGE